MRKIALFGPETGPFWAIFSVFGPEIKLFDVNLKFFALEF